MFRVPLPFACLNSSVPTRFHDRQSKKAVLIAQDGLFDFNPGDDLRSHTVTRAVSSARRGLTSVFGMGTGVTLAV